MTLGATTINLISETFISDEVGNQIATETSKTVFAELLPMAQSEFFQASSIGIKPEFEFIINGLDYDGQRIIEFNNQKYNVYRFYLREDEMCELYCELRIKNG